MRRYTEKRIKIILKGGKKRKNLSHANLSHANLRDADLRDADLSGANLRDAKNFINITNICPEGFFTAFKKTIDSSKVEYVVELLIPKTAQRINALSSRKIRVSRAKVIAHYTLDRKRLKGIVSEGKTNRGILYKDNKFVKPDKFDDSLQNECSQGIHCFLTFDEAKAW